MPDGCALASVDDASYAPKYTWVSSTAMPRRRPGNVAWVSGALACVPALFARPTTPGAVCVVQKTSLPLIATPHANDCAFTTSFWVTASRLMRRTAPLPVADA